MYGPPYSLLYDVSDELQYRRRERDNIVVGGMHAPDSSSEDWTASVFNLHATLRATDGDGMVARATTAMTSVT